MLLGCFSLYSTFHSFIFYFGVARKSILEFISHHLQIIIINQIWNQTIIISLLLSSLHSEGSRLASGLKGFCGFMRPMLGNFRTCQCFHQLDWKIMRNRLTLGEVMGGLYPCRGCLSLNHEGSPIYSTQLGTLHLKIEIKVALFFSLY